MTSDVNVSIFAYSPDEIAETLEPISGSRVIGKLDHDYIQKYCAMVNAEATFSDVTREVQLAYLSRMTELTADGIAVGQPPSVEEMLSQNSFSSEEEAARTFKAHSEFQYYYHDFWHSVRCEFDVWNEFLSVATGWNVVSLGKKFGA